MVGASGTPDRKLRTTSLLLAKKLAPEAGQSPHHPMDDVTLFHVSVPIKKHACIYIYIIPTRLQDPRQVEESSVQLPQEQ